MTPEEETVVRKGIAALKAAHLESDYYFRRYHDTRIALINCRLDMIELEQTVESLNKRLGDEGLDVNLGNDIPDVL